MEHWWITGLGVLMGVAAVVFVVRGLRARAWYEVPIALFWLGYGIGLATRTWWLLASGTLLVPVAIGLAQRAARSGSGKAEVWLIGWKHSSAGGAGSALVLSGVLGPWPDAVGLSMIVGGTGLILWASTMMWLGRGSRDER